MIAPPIRLETEWNLPLMMEVAFGAQKRRRFGQWGPTIVLGLFAAIALLLAYWTWQPFFLVLALVFVLIPQLQRFSVARYMKRELTAPLRQGKIQIELNDEGIETRHPLSRTFFAWSLVVDVVEAPLALHLKISSAMSQPIPYAALPEGVTPGDLRERVEAWRAGDTFA